MIRRLLSNGTTCAQIFATVHLQPCLLLADLLEQAGMRAFLGKVRRGGLPAPGRLAARQASQPRAVQSLAVRRLQHTPSVAAARPPLAHTLAAALHGPRDAAWLTGEHRECGGRH